MSYYINVSYHYYSGTCGAPSDGLLMEEDATGIQSFETREAAQSWIDEAEEGIYYLSHGEAGRPTYEIIDADDYGWSSGLPADEIPIYREEKRIAENDVPAAILKEMAKLDAEQTGEDDGIAVFEVSVCVGRGSFAQRYIKRWAFENEKVNYWLDQGDLSNLDWDQFIYIKA